VSSERFKTAVMPMGADGAKLAQLRPVTFHLKSDPHGPLQYGLIAEEVAKVYPELAIRDGSGRIDGVRYDELAPMLLNEVQQQQTRIAAQAQKIATQAELNAAQAAAIGDLKRQQIATHAEQVRMQQQVAELKILSQAAAVALRRIQSKDALIVQR
jgi:trimeric autotransporter adhesin